MRPNNWMNGKIEYFIYDLRKWSYIHLAISIYLIVLL